MNKLKVLAVPVIILIFAEAAFILYYSNKAQDLSRKLDSYQPELQKMTIAEQEMKDKYAQLARENEQLKLDRNNILNQAKSLVTESNRAKDLEGTLEDANKQMASLKGENSQLLAYNAGLQAEIKRLQDTQAETAKERDEFKVAYEKARKGTVIKGLKAEISAIQREKNSAENESRLAQKNAQQAMQQSAKLNEENAKLSAELGQYKNNYADAVKKNKALEQEIKNTPKKFSEIARQNKRMIKETAEMHYNLGVFYTKNKEYERAVAEFEKVVEINPDDSDAHFNLGYIYAEYLVNRKKAIEQFRHFLRLAGSDDKDIEWAKRYLITWETFEGKVPMK